MQDKRREDRLRRINTDTKIDTNAKKDFDSKQNGGNNFW